MNGTLGTTEDINITIRLQNTKAQLRKLKNENDQFTRDIQRLHGMLCGEKAQGMSKTRLTKAQRLDDIDRINAAKISRFVSKILHHKVPMYPVDWCAWSDSTKVFVSKLWSK